jgi:Tfp pilus assembly protein PilV
VTGDRRPSRPSPTDDAAAGFAVVEALVALLLAGVAISVLAASAAATVRHVRLARDRSIAVALAADRLEGLRAGPRDGGRDEIDAAGIRWVRTWSSDGGRGTPVQLQVEVEWPEGRVRLDSAVYP